MNETDQGGKRSVQQAWTWKTLHLVKHTGHWRTDVVWFPVCELPKTVKLMETLQNCEGQGPKESETSAFQTQ